MNWITVMFFLDFQFMKIFSLAMQMMVRSIFSVFAFVSVILRSPSTHSEGDGAIKLLDRWAVPQSMHVAVRDVICAVVTSG